VTVASGPDAGMISGADSVCPGRTIALTDNVTGGSWSSDFPSIAMVTGSGVVYGLATGIDNIRYTVTNSCGSASISVSIRVLSGLSTACDPSNVNTVLAPGFAELQIFPNPNQGFFTMNMLTENEVQVTVVITNVIGQKIKKFTTATNKNTDIQLRTPGIYLLTVITKDGRYVKKVIVE
jgi:hypothetical protein